MPAEAIKYTTQGDYACSWCGYRIPTDSRNIVLEWCNYDVAGMFCSKSHAMAAGNNLAYAAKWTYDRSVSA